MNEQKNFVTINTAAELSGLSRAYVRQRAKQGSIPILKVGKKYLIDYQSMVEQLKREAAASGTAE